MIPSSMRAERRWFVWRYSAEGKKLPHDPKNPAGKPIDSTDDALWVDYDTAAAVVAAGGVDGLGFALGDGWAGIDLDDVRDPASGTLAPAAKAILEQIDSYAEVSPSSTGVKIFVKAWLGRNHKRPGLEVYGYGRYFTVTGRHLPGTPEDVHTRGDEVAALVEKEFGVVEEDDVIPEDGAVDGDTSHEEGETELTEGSRNNTLAKIGGSLRRLNFSDDELLAALKAVNLARCKPPLPDSEVAAVARSVGRYAPSKAERAIEWMNAQHAVLTESGKTIIITERVDPVLKRNVIDRSTAADIRLRYCTRLVSLKVNGKPLRKPLGDYWLSHPGRREYSQMVFDPEVVHPPDVYNLWKGFAVTPKPGSWARLREHIHTVICGGNDAVFRYFEGWLARTVQKPGRPGEVALVMQGAQGAGKGILARALGKIFGQHFVHLARAHHLTGHFNAHLQDAVLVFADEAVWGGDKTADGALKALITEPTLVIERKGRDAYAVKNVIHLLLASNNDWVVPVGIDDRRFCVVRVRSDKVGNHAYFQAIQQEMAHGGFEAMLHDLLAYDLEAFDHRKPPTTTAGLHQKMLGMSPVQRWWFDKLKTGQLLPWREGWPTEVSRTELHRDYVEVLQLAGVGRRATESELGIAMKDLVPGLAIVRRTMAVRLSHHAPTTETRRERCWQLPSLDQCRKAFEGVLKQPVEWDEVTGGEDGELPMTGTDF